MDLSRVTFANKLVLETLISHCPVLESLSITSSLHDKTEVLHVCSHSLLSFIYAKHESAGVAIDAPRLKYLSLCDIVLPSLEFVTLPSLKVMDLSRVTFANKLVLETLISHCPVLESLHMTSSFYDGKEVLRLCSHSLLSFRYAEHDSAGVAIDAPRLEYLSFDDNKSDIIILNNSASLVKVDINAKLILDSGKFDPKRKIFHNFLLGISSVKDMIISASTLEVLFVYSIWGTLPLFRNLSFLRVELGNSGVELLPFVLKSCPNLKSLVVRFETYLETATDNIRLVSWGWLASLEHVEIEKPYKGKKMMMKLLAYLLGKSTNLKKLTISLGDSKAQEKSVIHKELNSIKIEKPYKGKTMIKELVAYLLEKSTNLKKLTLTLGIFKEQEESVILKELSAIPRASSLCQVIVR